jgi:hypothetical protein
VGCVFIVCLVVGACSDDGSSSRGQPTTSSKKENRQIGSVPVGLRQIAAGQAEVILPECGNYALTSAVLGPRAAGGGFVERSWAIVAAERRKVPRPASFVLGEAPPGFTELQPLTAPLPQDQPLAAVISFKWTKGKRFTRWALLDNFSINMLPIGDSVLVVFGGAESEGVISVQEFQERAIRGKCKNWPNADSD